MPVAEALRALDAPLTQQPWPTTLFLSGSSNYQIPNTENMIYRSFPYLGHNTNPFKTGVQSMLSYWKL